MAHHSIGHLLSVIWAAFQTVGLVLFFVLVPNILRQATGCGITRIGVAFIALFFVYGGGDYWYVVAADMDRLGVHNDGVSDLNFQAAIHSIQSLWIWVPSQLTTMAVALAVVATCLRRGWPIPMIVTSSYVLASVPFGIFSLVALCAYLACVGQPSLVAQLGALIGVARRHRSELLGTAVVALVIAQFYLLREHADPFIWNPGIGWSTYLKDLFVREFAGVVAAVAVFSTVDRDLGRRLATILGLVIPCTPFYMGLYNAWLLKVTIPISILIALVVAHGVVQHWSRRRVKVLAAGLLLWSGPLFMSELLFAWWADEHFIVSDREIVVQYHGPLR